MVNRIDTQGKSFTQLRDKLLDQFHAHQDKGRDTTDAIRLDKGQVYVKKGVTNRWARAKKLGTRKAKYEGVQNVLKQAINSEFANKQFNGQPIGDAVFASLGQMDKIDHEGLNKITQELAAVLKKADRDLKGDDRVRSDHMQTLFTMAQGGVSRPANKALAQWKNIVHGQPQVRDRIARDLTAALPDQYRNDKAGAQKAATKLMDMAGITQSDSISRREYHRLMEVMNDPANFPGGPVPDTTYTRTTGDYLERTIKSRLGAEQMAEMRADVEALRQEIPTDRPLSGPLKRAKGGPATESTVLTDLMQDNKNLIDEFNAIAGRKPGAWQGEMFRHMRNNASQIKRFANDLTVGAPRAEMEAREALRTALLEQSIAIEDMALSLSPSDYRGIPRRPHMTLAANSKEMHDFLNEPSPLHDQHAGDLGLRARFRLPYTLYDEMGISKLGSSKADENLEVLQRALEQGVDRLDAALERFNSDKQADKSDAALQNLHLAVEDAMRANDELMQRLRVGRRAHAGHLKTLQDKHWLKVKLGKTFPAEADSVADFDVALASTKNNRTVLQGLRAMISQVNDQRNHNARLPKAHPAERGILRDNIIANHRWDDDGSELEIKGGELFIGRDRKVLLDAEESPEQPYRYVYGKDDNASSYREDSMPHAHEIDEKMVEVDFVVDNSPARSDTDAKEILKPSKKNVEAKDASEHDIIKPSDSDGGSGKDDEVGSASPSGRRRDSVSDREADEVSLSDKNEPELQAQDAPRRNENSEPQKDSIVDSGPSEDQPRADDEKQNVSSSDSSADRDDDEVRRSAKDGGMPDRRGVRRFSEDSTSSENSHVDSGSSDYGPSTDDESDSASSLDGSGLSSYDSDGQDDADPVGTRGPNRDGEASVQGSDTPGGGEDNQSVDGDVRTENRELKDDVDVEKIPFPNPNAPDEREAIAQGPARFEIADDGSDSDTDSHESSYSTSSTDMDELLVQHMQDGRLRSSSDDEASLSDDDVLPSAPVNPTTTTRGAPSFVPGVDDAMDVDDPPDFQAFGDFEEPDYGVDGADIDDQDAKSDKVTFSDDGGSVEDDEISLFASTPLGANGDPDVNDQEDDDAKADVISIAPVTGGQGGESNADQAGDAEDKT